jgi:lauroyl/myristoyl acyltransferase
MEPKRDTSSPFERTSKAIQRFRRKLLPCVETVGLWIPSKIVPYLSRRAERRLARVLGAAMAFFPSRARRVAQANLDIVYGDTKTTDEKRAILRAAFKHAALVLLDYFWFSRHTAERLAHHCIPDNERMIHWTDNPFPGLLVTAHIGNWEVGGQYIALRGRSIWSVYRPLGTRRTIEPLLKFRQTTGQKVIARDGAMMGMMRALRDDGLVALLLDQHTPPPTAASTSTSLASPPRSPMQPGSSPTASRSPLSSSAFSTTPTKIDTGSPSSTKSPPKKPPSLDPRPSPRASPPPSNA